MEDILRAKSPPLQLLSVIFHWEWIYGMRYVYIHTVWSTDSKFARIQGEYILLTSMDALALGLPTPKLKINIWEKSWQTRVYDALSHFHTVNGFDPHSLAVASHAGLSIFQLLPQGRTDFGSSGEISSEFSSHFDEESIESRQTDKHGMNLSSSSIFPLLLLTMHVGGLKPTHIAVGIWLRLYSNILLGSNFLIVAFVAIRLSAVLFRGQWLD
ncbi:hypothetical protein C8R43DRAFT_269985 [Mycena crocata]|nr:hypothetical protein C8R43DRAFT_269985 [Mycena crocata]